ncbi:gonadotropin-releasing hormone receptor-like [Uloborus diversus]|uniref:gonadotropin-releasing hormone receptor-like n=1 Tax=Uloborus diversus TaxID=327109 RepID=UPI00240987BE|nr:gonadotropin-releasing hormone receptor-like [Uloborus diversus]
MVCPNIDPQQHDSLMIVIAQSAPFEIVDKPPFEIGLNANICSLQTSSKILIHDTETFNGSTSSINSNISCTIDAPIFNDRAKIRVIILSTISIVSLIGNIAVLITIRRNHRKSQSTIYLLIGVLAIADLSVTTFCVVVDAIWAYTVQWMANDAVCKMVKFLQMFSLYFSTFLLVVIGYDRYDAIRYPMRRAYSKRKVRKLLLVAVLLSAVFSTPQGGSEHLGKSLRGDSKQDKQYNVQNEGPKRLSKDIRAIKV